MTTLEALMDMCTLKYRTESNLGVVYLAFPFPLTPEIIDGKGTTVRGENPHHPLLMLGKSLTTLQALNRLSHSVMLLCNTGSNRGDFQHSININTTE